MSCTHSTRRYRRRQEKTLKSRKDDFGNCWEEGYEQTRELRKCLGCDRGHPRGGCESESAGRTDAEDRSTPEEHDWTQAEAASRCGVTQPRINDLLRGRVSGFSLDALVNIATALGCRVRIDLDAA